MTLSVCMHCKEGVVDNLIGAVCNKCGKSPYITFDTTVDYVPVFYGPTVTFDVCPTCGSCIPQKETKKDDD